MTLLVLLAVFAGALTTISGFGGGILLVVAVTAVAGAKPALAATAIALLVANVHRIWLYRGSLERRVTAPLLAGLIPGALAGALAAAWIPALLVQLVMLGVVALSIARAWLGWTWRPGARTLTASGWVVGALAGAAGGAGFLIGPVVLAAGLVGTAYLGTIAVSAVAMHVARIVGYGAGGLVTTDVLAMAAALVPALLVGNLIGNRLRDFIPERTQRAIELGAPVVCVVLALVGLA